MRQTPGRAATVLVLALALLALIHAAAWFTITAVLDQQFETAVANLRNRGWKIDHGPIAHSGYPIAARIDIGGLRVTRQPGGETAQSATLSLAISVLHPTILAIDAAAPHLVSLPAAPPAALAGPPLHATATLLRPTRITLAAHDQTLQTGAGNIHLATLDAELDLPGATDTDGEEAKLRLTITGIDLTAILPEGARDPLIALLLLDAGLTAPARATSPRDWRDAGGRLTLRQLAVRWGALDAEITAIIELDSNLQPTGAGVLAAAGVADSLDAAVGAGLIPFGAARTARGLLPLLPRRPDGRLNLPLSLRDRTLAIASFPIAIMPELRLQ